MSSGEGRARVSTAMQVLHVFASLLAVVPFVAGVLAALAGAAILYVIALFVVSAAVAGSGWVVWHRLNVSYATVDPSGVTASHVRADPAIWGNPEASRWMTTPGDLGTLTLDGRELDRVFRRVTKEARQRLGYDAELRLSSLCLLPTPKMVLRAHSAAAKKSSWVDATASEARFWSVERDEVGDWRGSFPGGPWRQDKSWRRLVGQSWLAVRPFVGHALMQFGPSGAGMAWRITYVRDEGGVAGLPETYVLDRGSAVRG
jgi:hypothetical protein